MNFGMTYGYTSFCLSVHQLIDIWVFPLFDYFELGYDEHSCTSVSVDICFKVSWLYT